MQIWNNRFSSFWRPLNRRYNAFKARLLRPYTPIKIFTFRGYGRRDKIFLQGRVIKDKFINVELSDSKWRNFVNTFKRFRSYEIPDAQLEIKIGQHQFELKTDSEGYFTLDEPLDPPLQAPVAFWQNAFIKLNYIPNQELEVESLADFIVPTNASFGIISDIDDTIIKTEVLSLLKLRTLYLTILKNAGTRKSFLQVAAFYQALAQGSNKKAINPFFYVSNSPWNLYDLLDDFIQLNQLPPGPVLLRDFGVTPDKMPTDYLGHKHYSVCKIIQTYPDFPFILIGDSAEKDADIYLSVARTFPGRVAAIFIRDVRSRKRAQRIRELIESAPDVNIHLIQNYAEAASHASNAGLIDPSLFEELNKK